MYKEPIQARTLIKTVALLVLDSTGILVSLLASADEGRISGR
jgi:hypothetical protein